MAIPSGTSSPATAIPATMSALGEHSDSHVVIGMNRNIDRLVGIRSSEKNLSDSSARVTFRRAFSRSVVALGKQGGLQSALMYCFGAAMTFPPAVSLARPSFAGLSVRKAPTSRILCLSHLSLNWGNP